VRVLLSWRATAIIDGGLFLLAHDWYECIKVSRAYITMYPALTWILHYLMYTQQLHTRQISEVSLLLAQRLAPTCKPVHHF
jgi:hypothetical protein